MKKGVFSKKHETLRQLFQHGRGGVHFGIPPEVQGMLEAAMSAEVEKQPRHRATVVLVGPSGVGKSAAFEHIAEEIAMGPSCRVVGVQIDNACEIKDGKWLINRDLLLNELANLDTSSPYILLVEGTCDNLLEFMDDEETLKAPGGGVNHSLFLFPRPDFFKSANLAKYQESLGREIPAEWAEYWLQMSDLSHEGVYDFLLDKAEWWIRKSTAIGYDARVAFKYHGGIAMGGWHERKE